MQIPRSSSLIIGGAVVIFVLGGLWLVSRPSVPETPSVQPKVETLDTGVFADQLFTRLHAAPLPLPPVDRGRSNPFSPPVRSRLPSAETPVATSTPSLP